MKMSVSSESGLLSFCPGNISGGLINSMCVGFLSSFLHFRARINIQESRFCVQTQCSLILIDVTAS